MGMYSFFQFQEISVTDKEGLANLGAVCSLETEEDEWSPWHGLIQLQNTDKREDVAIDFSAWNEHKIEGYWYDETIEALCELAKYIEGFAEFEYEEGYHFRICFEKGKPYFKTGRVDWDELKGELLKNEKRKKKK